MIFSPAIFSMQTLPLTSSPHLSGFHEGARSTAEKIAGLVLTAFLSFVSFVFLPPGIAALISGGAALLYNSFFCSGSILEFLGNICSACEPRPPNFHPPARAITTPPVVIMEQPRIQRPVINATHVPVGEASAFARQLRERAQELQEQTQRMREQLAAQQLRERGLQEYLRQQRARLSSGERVPVGGGAFAQPPMQSQQSPLPPPSFPGARVPVGGFHSQ